MSGRRGGFTMVEGLVVGLLLGIVSVALWTVFMQGNKREARVDFRLKAIQAAALACARLSDDFSQLLPIAPRQGASETAEGVRFDRTPEKGGGGPDGMPLTAAGLPAVQPVTYRFDAASRRLLRDGRPVGPALYHDLDMTYTTTPKDGYQLKVDMEMVPEDEPVRPGVPPRKLDFACTFHSPQGTLALVHGTWAGDE